MTNKVSLTRKEIDAVILALKFYVYHVTHPHGENDARPGLPEGPEKILLQDALKKLEVIS